MKWSIAIDFVVHDEPIFAYNASKALKTFFLGNGGLADRQKLVYLSLMKYFGFIDVNQILRIL